MLFSGHARGAGAGGAVVGGTRNRGSPWAPELWRVWGLLALQHMLPSLCLLLFSWGQRGPEYIPHR